MTRREFLKKSLLAGAALTVLPLAKTGSSLFAQNNNPAASTPDLVAVRGGMPDVMFDSGIKSMGGMSRFVKKGAIVVVKPNIGWDAAPERAANTNPRLVKRVIEHCIEAGAKKVYVFDHTCNQWKSCYNNSGIEKAAREAGAIVAPGNKADHYELQSISQAKKLKSVKVHELVLEADTFINIPVLKDHSSTRVTIAMKNLMGCIWDRRYYHSNNLSQCIVDFCHFRKPDLNIVDAYQIMTKNGPRGISTADVKLTQMQLLSTDIVGIDTAATKILGLEPEIIRHIKLANDQKIGTMDLNQLKIKRITV